jgi:hypothetical protein
LRFIDLRKENSSSKLSHPIRGGMSKKSTPKKIGAKSAGCKRGNCSDLGWKQRDIAEALGVTEGTVSQWFIDPRKHREWKLCSISPLRDLNPS